MRTSYPAVLSDAGVDVSIDMPTTLVREMSSLPREARRRLSASLELEDQPAHRPLIPVTAGGWNSVLGDAGLVLDGELADVLDAAHAAAETENPVAIRTATRQLADAAARAIADLHLMEAFQASADGRTAGARRSIESIVRDAIEAVVHGDVSAQAQRRQSFSDVVVSMGRDPTVVDDPLAAVFGVGRDELVDGHGSVSVERIVATLHRQGRLGRDLIEPILAPITADPPGGFILIRTALPHLTSPRPLLTLRTAVEVQQLILRRVAVDVSDAGAVLRTLKLGVERSAASHRGMLRVQAELNAATAPSDVAYLTLDLYRRFVESQVRPWGWALLRLTAVTAQGTPSELGTMRQQLRAAPERLLNSWAETILPTVRNAAAHEDFTWDHELRALRVGTAIVSLADLETAIEHGYSMMIGAESGWACARANSHALAVELDAEDHRGGSRTLSLRAALSRFGTNGLHVRTASWEGTLVVIELDELAESDINPCFQAVIESIEYVKPEHFEIRVVGQDGPIIRLTADAVGAARDLWLTAVRYFRKLPTSVFVPLNLEARLDIEDVDTANRAAAWLVLDGAVTAHRDHDWRVPDQARRLALRLQLARHANELINHWRPEICGDPFDRATRLIQAAETSARATSAGLALPDPGLPVRQLQAAFHALPRPRILPTLEI